MQRITLATLREEIGFAADVPVGDNRVPTATLNRLINRAIKEYDELLSGAGLGNKTRTTVTTDPSTTPGSDGFPANQTALLPADFRRLVAVFIVDGGRKTLLRPILPVQRENPSDWYQVTQGAPRGYSLLSESSSDEARLWLWPPADAAYTLEVVYEPYTADMTTDGTVWYYAPGSEDIVICGVALRLLMRDGGVQANQIAMLNERIERAKQALENHANRDTGVLSMKDDQRRIAREAWLLGEI